MPDYSVLVDSIDLVLDQVSSSVDGTNQLVTFCHKIAEVEQSYAKQMTKHCESAGQKCLDSLSGSVLGAFQALFDEVKTIIAGHKQRSACLMLLGEPKQFYVSGGKKLTALRLQQAQYVKLQTSSEATMNKAARERAGQWKHYYSQEPETANSDKAVKADNALKKAINEYNLACNVCRRETARLLGMLQNLDEKARQTQAGYVATVSDWIANTHELAQAARQATTTAVANTDINTDMSMFEIGTNKLLPAPRAVDFTPYDPLASNKKKGSNAEKEKKNRTGHFGVPIESLLDEGRALVPKLVVGLVKEMENRSGFETEGIFRVNAVSEDIDVLEARLNSGGTFEEDDDVHTIASVLKLWIRKLPSPLVTHEAYQNAVKASNIIEMVAVLQSLPGPERSTLCFIFELLARMARPDVVSATKMDKSNLAIVFAPCILRNPAPHIERVVEDSKHERAFALLLIDHLSNEDTWCSHGQCRGLKLHDKLLCELHLCQKCLLKEKSSRDRVCSECAGISPKKKKALEVTPGDGRVSLSWPPPPARQSKNYACVTAVSTPGGFKATGSAFSPPLVVSGLTNGVAYSFELLATTEDGRVFRVPFHCDPVIPVGPPAEDPSEQPSDP